MISLKINQLSFSAGNTPVLQGLDLLVEEHTIHALVGTNGSGKTSLARIIMGCAGYTPTIGQVIFQEQVINDMPIHQRAKLGITMTWQEPARFEGLRIIDYISIGKSDSDPTDCLQRVGLPAELYLERAVDKTLSGGERKRVELAAVLAMQPKLAILDEPASGIDMLSIQEIIGVIRTLQKQGTTVLLITHRQEIVCIADTASYLCGGKIVATGAPEKIAQQYQSRRCVVCNGEICRD